MRLKPWILSVCVGLSMLFSDSLSQASSIVERHAELYNQAVKLLESGRNYVIAASMLRRAIKADPNNSDYHIALACADADRASSLEYANSYQQMLNSEIKSYPQDLADWRKAQLDPKADDYGYPEPKLPKHRVFATKDDGLPLTLSDSEVKKQVRLLALSAEKEWRLGIRFSSSRKSRGAAENSYAWGLRLLRNFEEDSFDSSLPNMSDSRITQAFHQATIDDPNNASYWEFYGYYIGNKSGLPDQAADRDMSAAYRHSLAIDPNNPGLWMGLAKHDLGDTLTAEWDSSNEQMKMGEADIKMAIRYDPNSAYLHYWLAEILLNHTQYRNILNTPVPSYLPLIPQVAKEVKKRDQILASEAIYQIKLGNKCALFQKQRLDDADVPQMMRPARDYWNIQDRLWNPVGQFPDFARNRNLARDACGYAYVLGYQGKTSEAIDAANAVIGVGSKMAGNWPYKDAIVGVGSDEGIQTLVAIAVDAIGYKCLERIAENSGDGALINQSEELSSVFNLRNTAFRAKMMAYLATQDESSLLDKY